MSRKKAFRSHLILVAALCGTLICLFRENAMCQTPPPPQEEDKHSRIKDAVDSFVQSHKHKIGILRVQPRVSFGAGVDANSAFGDEDVLQDDTDYFMNVSPGVSAGLKFGSRAYFRILEDLNFVYYTEHDNRSDIYNSTRGEFVTGSDNVLVRLFGSYYQRESQFDEELDEPVEHEIAEGNLHIDYSATRRIDVHHTARLTQTKFEETQEVIDSGLTLVDRRSAYFGTGAGYHLTHVLQLTADVNFGTSEALQTSQTSHFWTVLGGFDLRKERVHGYVRLGFGESTSENDTKNRNFVMEAELNGRFGRRLTIGGFASRRYAFSVLQSDATRLTTQGGIRINYSLTDRFGLVGNYTIGTNDYGDALIAGETVEQDIFQYGHLGVNVRLIRWFSITPGVVYYRRETNIPELDKQAFGFTLTAGVGYTFNF